RVAVESFAADLAVSWTGGTLQRATTLSPPDWQEVPVTNGQFVMRVNTLEPMAFFRASSAVVRLDAAKPPGGNFDLSHWKLTLPDAVASEISAAQLTAGITNAFFFTDADGAMVFRCPVTGG